MLVFVGRWCILWFVVVCCWLLVLVVCCVVFVVWCGSCWCLVCLGVFWLCVFFVCWSGRGCGRSCSVLLVGFGLFGRVGCLFIFVSAFSGFEVWRVGGAEVIVGGRDSAVINFGVILWRKKFFRGYKYLFG